jgi:uncharacterized protein (TIGR02117 family)
MRMAMARVLMFFALAACGACTAPVKDSAPPHETEPVTALYLVSHGWHVGMIIRQADIPDGVWPSGRDFPDAEYLEVGWGDRTFYQALNPHFGHALKSALLPTESVLYIFGFSGSVAAHFPYSEIVEIELPTAGMQRLAGHIAASYARDDVGNITSLGEEFYPNRRFYPSRETYHLFNTGNVWAARALCTAGLPIAPAQAMKADGLMAQARRIGTVVQSSPVKLSRRRHQGDSRLDPESKVLPPSKTPFGMTALRSSWSQLKRLFG